jgi:hypothetical protein
LKGLESNIWEKPCDKKIELYDFIAIYKDLEKKNNMFAKV